MTLSSVLLIIAVVLWSLAAAGVPTSRWNLGWLGMVFFGLYLLFSGVGLHIR